MAEVISMLALSPTMDEGTLVEWMKSEGDAVEEGEIIAEIETDKATMEMESFHDGTILKLIASKGDALPVGAPLAIVGEEGEDISELLADLESGGDSDADKDQDEEAGQDEDSSSESTDSTQAQPARQSTSDDDGSRLKASPLARRMAEEEGIELKRVDGSGPNGRIIKRDIEEAMKSGAARGAVAQSTRQRVDSEPEEAPLSQMRKTIAKRLVQVWETTPHFYLTMTIDMAKAMKTRKEINEQLAAAEEGVKISVNDMIVKAVAGGLARYPKMNVAFQGDHLLQYADVHVGVAVALEDGLITPVIKHADTKSLTEISTEIRELASRAQDKRLKPEEYTGSTFSVSNLGMYGIDHFSAIINPPEAAILACGAVQKQPVVNDEGELAVGTTMKVTLSVDHRAADGAVGSEFLIELKRLLENPLMLMI